ncbi:pyrroline-5-carboxylate reductase [Ascoidea rubescens DSM 1968]|uniref:Pyrroline-5-carboxylate reductase n=1 Tax=Ascoidea rubescens DSM 1968 TaxID=1344418 RepID=A0A1D2VR95_9ASCO|nr:delta 1-pyrroline-5-carboxylate reductase, catalyzes the last step in proline biosynthesis [Ascoidea rubescens DSM 1968]ODV64087.1 delta 1-pyrroline-5-carboxylate reductase, catalyzes the last step in proline biosynthesis [Ascoidea rubescens DSM 1968]
MSSEGPTLCILGCGVMGTAVLQSLLNAEKFDGYPSKIYTCTVSEDSAADLQAKYPTIISTFNDNKNSVKNSDIILLACKPFYTQKILDEVKNEIKDKLIISLVAGWTIDQLSTYSPYVSRVMTNTPAKFGCGMAVISYPTDPTYPFSEHNKSLVFNLIKPVGDAIVLPENLMDAATSLVGSGPAFCLLILESLIEGGLSLGIPYDEAKKCASKVMEGTAKMVLETNEHPALLKSQVCTPGGTTIGGLMVMEDKGVRSGIARAVQEAAAIAKRLGKKD